MDSATVKPRPAPAPRVDVNLAGVLANPEAANKTEHMKLAKDGLDVYEDILRYAELGYEAIDPADMDRLKWYGVYTQRPKEDGYFMFRTKVPNGFVSAKQFRVLGEIARDMGRNLADITTRQDIQYHWLRIEHFPEVFARLHSVGMSSAGACGDITRNVVGCPAAGLDAREFLDASTLVLQATDFFDGNQEFSNLPRKYKISISGCAHYCAQHEINDLGLVATRRGANGTSETGFDLWVGGGLSATPHFAKRLGAFVRQEQVMDVVREVTAIFRDEGYRKSRQRARLKFLVADWGPEKFRDVLETRLGYRLEDGLPPVLPANAHRDHVGVFPQKNTDQYYVGVATLRGRLTGDQVIRIADLSEQYSVGGNIRLSNRQNFILSSIPEASLEPLARDLAEIDLHVEPSAFRRGTIACTGIQFCKEAVVETKDRGEEIVRHLEATLPEFKEQIVINVTGCPNACTQYQTADIGFMGSVVKVDGEQQEAFQVFLGGRMGQKLAFGRRLKRRVAATETKNYVEALVRSYQRLRQDGETFSDFLNRLSVEELETLA